MKNTNLLGRVVAVAAMLLLVSGGLAFAQNQSGNLFGKVSDDQGNKLPGVTVTLTGTSAPQTTVTDSRGEFRFPNLPPSTYKVRAELQGFGTIDDTNVSISVGRNTDIDITMNASIKDVINVTTESPLLDQHQINKGATVSQTELEKIPTARDPWAILQSTPGVLTDRINVGGNESGQQSDYVGPGSAGTQSVWAVDGVVITDMAALGSSPAYYDFDSFAEMQVSTGGSDSTLATGGVTLNIVTKRGTNEWRGTARYLDADNSWQSNTSFDNGDLGKGGPWNSGKDQPPFKAGNRIVKVEDYGAEVGGPIVKDRLWIWGSYAKPKVDLLTVADVSDKTTLESYNVKLNGQIANNNSATLFMLQSNKVKLGRNAGPTRTQPTTWDQSDFGDKPTAGKIEDTHIFNSNFYLTGLYSVVNGGFQFDPEGGTDTTAWRGPGKIWYNTYVLFHTDRPTKQGKADGSAFFNTGTVSHELKFGAGYRQAEVESLSRWPGAGFEIYIGEPNLQYAILARDAAPKSTTKYTSGYLQDTVTFGNMTINGGLRYDRQTGVNEAQDVAANPVFPDLLPAVHYAGADAGFVWTNVTPRLGLTYALGKERKTLLRASYSRFADQLGSAQTTWLNPLYPASYVYGYAANSGNGSFNRGDFTPNGAVSGNYNPVTHGLLISNAVDPNLKAPTTDEFLLSAEHALLPEFVVGVNLTYRKYNDILGQNRLVFDGDAHAADNLDSVGRPGVRSDYVLEQHHGVLPNGQPYTLNYYELRDGVTTRNGFLLYNTDRSQTFKGASIVFNKRLANHWSMRGNFSLQDWTWNAPAQDNPDPTITTQGLTGASIRNGDVVVQGSGTASGSKAGVFINSKWSYALNGLYQIAPERPWGFNVAGDLSGRQGYPLLYLERFSRNTVADGAGLGTPILIQSTSDAQRYPDVSILNLRVEKEFTVSDVGLTLGVDCFNVFNRSTILQRQGIIGCNNAACTSNNTTGNYVQEIVSPRIFRLGARISLK